LPDAACGNRDLIKFCRLDELGLQVVGQQIKPDRAVLACRVAEPDRWCRRRGCRARGPGRDRAAAADGG